MSKNITCFKKSLFSQKVFVGKCTHKINVYQLELIVILFKTNQISRFRELDEKSVKCKVFELQERLAHLVCCSFEL